MGEAGLAQLHGGLEVDRHTLVNVLAADLDEVLPRQVASVVDEDVEAAHDGDGLADLIDETPPAVSGSSATNRTKTATLSTGFEIQVPEYLSIGDSVKVNTSTGKFMSRS